MPMTNLKEGIKQTITEYLQRTIWTNKQTF
jgi:dTDP-D-glucose 4,6-dehydratase